MKAHRIIALMTDFGVEDGYVAAMKGVISRIAPAALVIDISHHIKPQNINQGAFVLWSVFRYFPKRTIFVCVVDPGVGTKRNILCVETKDHIFLAPDNGILKFILQETEPRRIVSVSEARYRNRNVSATFHGRDIFAPAAAQLAKGLPVRKLGPAVTATRRGNGFVNVSPAGPKRYRGSIIHVDHFGNLITDFRLSSHLLQSSRVKVGQKTIARRAVTYAQVKARVPFLLLGSSGLLEISCRNGSAAAMLHARAEQPVHLYLE